MSEATDVPIGVGTESALQTDSSTYNAGTLAKQQIHEEVNSAMNWHIIVERIKAGTARDVSQEPKANKTPAFVIGSGPSLDHSIQYLKDWKGGIFCTTSHALTLMRYGIEPTHIVALDPFSTWEEIEGVDWSKTKTKLVAQPGVWPTLIENWPNEILLYLQNLGRPDSYYATYQKRMYTHREDQGKGIRDPLFVYYIPTEITLFACSPPVQMFLADFLGYGNIFLAGVDFAYSETLDRFTSYTVKKNENDIIEWEEHVHPFKFHDKMLKSNNGLYSETIHLYYKKNFLSAWRLSKQTVYTTDHGAITEVPFVDIQKVIKHQGTMPKQSEAFVIHAVENYLAGVGAFIVDTNKGVSFVESYKPAFDLPRYMYELSAQYDCPECKAHMKANDFFDHEGEECANCHKGKLTHEHIINVQENLKKFKYLLKVNNIPVVESEWEEFYIFCEKRRQEITVYREAEAQKILATQPALLETHGEAMMQTDIKDLADKLKTTLEEIKTEMIR
jgi:hypothetical protein